jgi:hypothetical protein
MRRAMVAVALIATTLPVYASDTTREFLDKYASGDNMYARLYLRGIGDGLPFVATKTDAFLRTDVATSLRL